MRCSLACIMAFVVFWSADRGIAANSATDSFDDPFEYCAAAGSVDRPGPHYTGPSVPEAIVNLGGTFADQANTIWRCMDGLVWACVALNTTACQRAPWLGPPPKWLSNSELVRWCNENPNSEIIPGTHAMGTCSGSMPAVAKGKYSLDGRGYAVTEWVRIPAPEEATFAERFEPPSGMVQAEVKPSYDCSKATRPDEIAICSNSALALLDQRTTEAFERSRARDKDNALAFARTFLGRRGACGSEVACIEKEQRTALSVYERIAGGRSADMASSEALADPNGFDIMGVRLGMRVRDFPSGFEPLLHFKDAGGGLGSLRADVCAGQPNSESIPGLNVGGGCLEIYVGGEPGPDSVVYALHLRDYPLGDFSVENGVSILANRYGIPTATAPNKRLQSANLGWGISQSELERLRFDFIDYALLGDPKALSLIGPSVAGPTLTVGSVYRGGLKFFLSSEITLTQLYFVDIARLRSIVVSHEQAAAEARDAELADEAERAKQLKPKF